jgi:hypothetical protein
MRRSGAAICVLVLLGACNQILGNDGDHHLVGDVEPTGGTEGTGATSSSSGSGGKSSSGASGKTSSSGSQNDAGADTGNVGGSGEAGEGPVGPCTPTGAEDCLNGQDDDCNGDVDCADAACSAGPFACVTAPTGASLGYFTTMADCAAGYEPVTLSQGLTAAPECTGCTCTPDTVDCDSSLGASTPGTCPGDQVSGQTYVVLSSKCQAVAPNSTQVHYYSVRGLSTCTPGGTGVLSSPTWMSTRTFCELKVGKGCGNGQVCAPQNSTDTAVCTRLSGQQACTAALGTSMGGEPWSPSYTDERQCQCQCSFGNPSCGAAHIRLFSGGNCTGQTVDLGSGAADGNHCTIPFTPVSGQIVGGSPNGNSCPVNAFAFGDLLPDSPRTICCL